jgi:pimeloyl-ACP methyl ester carboxylesterase
VTVLNEKSVKSVSTKPWFIKGAQGPAWSTKRLVFRLLISAGLWAAAVGAGGCTRDFSVRRIQAAATGSVPARSADQCFRTLQESERATSSDSAAQTARRQAITRLVELYGSALLAAPGHTLQVSTSSGRSCSLSLRQGEGAGGIDPSCFTALEPTDDFVVSGVDHYSRTSGQGAPLVGTLRPMEPVHSLSSVTAQPVAGFERALTAVALVGRGWRATVVLALYDPHTTGQAAEPGRALHPLAADYTTPLALELAHFRPQRRGLLGLLRGGDYFPSTGLFALEKPTPGKTPLVLVHGLISDPGDFHVLYNDLEGNDEIRRRYQVWIFYYPTSLPVVYAAMLLREDLHKFIHQLDPDHEYPAMHHAVLVGHSMGGLLCRMVISNGGDRYYHHFFGRPLNKLWLSPSDRATVRHLFYYHASQDVAQVVFIATPHCGSRLATGLLGNVGRTLLQMPAGIRLRFHNMLVRNRSALSTMTHNQPYSSLDSLIPDGPVISAIKDMPMRPGVRLHSILGDRAPGGPRNRSSDGVVPYASSHLLQAESEVIEPASHTGTLKRPETIAELVRILTSPSVMKRASSSTQN